MSAARTTVWKGRRSLSWRWSCSACPDLITGTFRSNWLEAYELVCVHTYQHRISSMFDVPVGLLG